MGLRKKLIHVAPIEGHMDNNLPLITKQTRRLQWLRILIAPHHCTLNTPIYTQAHRLQRYRLPPAATKTASVGWR